MNWVCNGILTSKFVFFNRGKILQSVMVLVIILCLCCTDFHKGIYLTQHSLLYMHKGSKFKGLICLTRSISDIQMCSLTGNLARLEWSCVLTLKLTYSLCIDWICVYQIDSSVTMETDQS